MITSDAVEGLIGADALDPADDRIGEVSQVYVDAASDRPTWVSVRLTLLRSAEVLVPLAGADWDERVLHVAVKRDVAREAPRIEMDEPLTTIEQERLYAHYGIPCLRHPRSPLGEMQVDPDEISYSIREESYDSEPDGVLGDDVGAPKTLIRS